MSRFQLLFSASCAVFVYVCISIFVGQHSLWAYSQLQSHKVVLAQHLISLQDVNEQLTIDTHALREDESVLRAYAKKMGFVNDGEKLLKISGFADTPAFVYNAGSKILRPELIFVPDWLAKCIGFFVFLSINVILSLLYLKKSIKSYDTAKVES